MFFKYLCSYFSTKTYVVGTHLKCLAEPTTCFHEEIRKNISTMLLHLELCGVGKKLVSTLGQTNFILLVQAGL